MALLMLALTACRQPVQPPPLVSPAAAQLTDQSDAAYPPPRPTAAPPALSPPSSPAPSPRAAEGVSPGWPAETRAALLGDLGDSGLLIGVESGFYVDQGLVVRAQRYESASAARSAMAAGLLDAVCLPVSATLFDWLHRETGARIVAEATGSPPGHAAGGLAVRPDRASTLRAARDLRGLTIGLPARDSSLEVELTLLLSEGGLGHTDVQLVETSPSEADRELAESHLDAAMLPEPRLSLVAQNGSALIWRRSDRIFPNHSSSVLVLGSRLTRIYPEIGRRFVTAYLRSVRVYNDALLRRKSGSGSVRVTRVVGPAAGLDERETQAGTTWPGIDPNGMVNIQSLRLDQAIFLARGQQQREINLAAVVEPQFAAYAITQLGEYR